MAIEFKINDKIDCSPTLRPTNNTVNKNKPVMITVKAVSYTHLTLPTRRIV